LTWHIVGKSSLLSYGFDVTLVTNEDGLDVPLTYVHQAISTLLGLTREGAYATIKLTDDKGITYGDWLIEHDVVVGGLL